jgi:hypothetical protein
MSSGGLSVSRSGNSFTLPGETCGKLAAVDRRALRLKTPEIGVDGRGRSKGVEGWLFIHSDRGLGA